MNAPLRLAPLLLSLLSSACLGGSGSSGFDISPAAEDRQIATSLAENRCLSDDGITFCPARSEDPSVPTPTPVDTPNSLSVSIARNEIEPDSCMVDGACTLNVTFLITGLDPSMRYQLAVRDATATSGWILEPAAAPLDGTSFSTTTRVAADELGTQIAVLLYFDGDASAAGRLETLSESGADVIFVTP